MTSSLTFDWQINMSDFTPFASTIGGVLIGLSAVLLMAFNGRIAGVSGISSSVLPPWTEKLNDGDLGWRVAFVAGLLIAPILTMAASGFTVGRGASTNISLMVIAGLLTGFGSVYGSGCTSGHGVCGMSRLSTRSLVATGVFMTTAFITVFIARHVVGG